MIGALIGFMTAWKQRKYDIGEVLKNGAIWGAILGTTFLVVGNIGGVSLLSQFLGGNIKLSGLTGNMELFFGPFVFGLIDTFLGSITVPIYKWLETIRV